MVPTPAIRETVVLIIFGIVLVPIAAKRAQDAPGYWQTFSTRPEQSLACTGDPDPPWSSEPTLMANQTLTYIIPAAEDFAKVRQVDRRTRHQSLAWPKPNESIPMYASRATQAEASPMTILFRIARAGESSDGTTTAESPKMAEATVAPAATSPVDSSTEMHTVAKAPAASKERWTLTWMSAAIAAVALFMLSC